MTPPNSSQPSKSVEVEQAQPGWTLQNGEVRAFTASEAVRDRLVGRGRRVKW